MREHLSGFAGRSGVYELLASLESDPRAAVDEGEVLKILEAADVVDAAGVLHELEARGLLMRVGNDVSLSTAGLKTVLLLEAVNGGDLQDVWRRLRYIAGYAGGQYSLVREGMTTGFFRSLVSNPSLGALYVCSPWINLSRQERRYLTTAVLRRQRVGPAPELFVITRPDDGFGTPRANLTPFEQLGAAVYLHPKLHAKLYMREPSMSGGYTMAIVGSQNLTRSKYIELGIRIEADSIIVKRLIGYFFDISHHSEELR